MIFRFRQVSAVAITFLLMAEPAQAQTCRQLFRSPSKNTNLLQQIRTAAPEDAAPLLAELGRKISLNQYSDKELLVIVSGIFRNEILMEGYARPDLILARYQRTLLWEISDDVQRSRVLGLIDAVSE